MKKDILKYAFINSLLTACYISLVAFFFFYGTRSFPQGPDTVFAPMLMLMLLVFSVALMGILIFGRPILWYVDGRKKEAIGLLGYTLSILFIIIFLVLIVLVMKGA
jgi:hypothetical protein